MRENNEPLKILFIVFMLILLISAINVSAQDSVASDFTLTDIDGDEFSVSDYRGKVVLLEFFGRKCDPCIREIPHLKALQEKFGESLEIISISVRAYATDDHLRQYREEYEITWKIARDTAGVADKYNVQYIPTLVIIDRDGYIRYQHVGLTEESILSKEVKELRKEPPVASFTYSPTNPVVGETVNFNASASHDPDGTIISYEWDFGDGATSTGVIATHAYAADATYTVTLTVTDNDNTFDNTRATVTVSPSTVRVHDVAITSVTTFQETVTVGESISISVEAKNEGTEAETFDITVYYDTAMIGTQTIINLASGASKKLTFSWDTAEVSPRAHTIKVVTSTVMGETDTADNILIDGTITVQEAPKTASDNHLYMAAGIAAIMVVIMVYVMRARKSKPA